LSPRDRRGPTPVRSRILDRTGWLLASAEVTTLWRTKDRPSDDSL
jgi:hypothetical protein